MVGAEMACFDGRYGMLFLMDPVGQNVLVRVCRSR